MPKKKHFPPSGPRKPGVTADPRQQGIRAFDAGRFDAAGNVGRTTNHRFAAEYRGQFFRTVDAVLQCEDLRLRPNQWT